MARTINEEIVRHESRLMQDKSPRNFIVSRRHRQTTKRLKETRQRKGKERSEGRGVAVTARTDRGASGIPPGDAKVREAAQTTHRHKATTRPPGARAGGRYDRQIELNRRIL